jgi:cell division protein ZapD
MTAAEPVLYEQPINEHIRVCLRLEHLFSQVIYWMRGKEPLETRSALAALLEILNVSDRPDLKTKFVKEFSRYVSILNRFMDTPHIDRARLSAISQEVNQTIHQMHAMQGRVAQSLRDNDFLTTVRQNLVTPSGGCSFDVPAYHYWLHTPASERTSQISHWLGNLKVLRTAVDLTLRLVRQSSPTELREAEEGFFQMSLDSQAPCQLVRVMVAHGAGVYPEISVGRHGLSIRFYRLELDGRPKQVPQDVKFHLTCCVF